MQSRGGDLGRGARAGVEEREEKRTVQERSQCAADEMGFHQSGARYRCYKDYPSESRCALQVGPSLRRRVAVPSVTPKGEGGCSDRVACATGRVIVAVARTVAVIDHSCSLVRGN